LCFNCGQEPESNKHTGLCKQCYVHWNSGKNLTLLEAIENTKQLPQVQYDLQRQLRELRVMANKLGLYDAADFIKPYCD
jgi:predicted ATP-dependent serine protease